MMKNLFIAPLSAEITITAFTPESSQVQCHPKAQAASIQGNKPLATGHRLILFLALSDKTILQSMEWIWSSPAFTRTQTIERGWV
ncbi:hypothetical protein [Chitinophaga eiseniae]|uniref:Uncharacterized protein n=1 Tax=Chitinophaga eiseniae TaxID=634771 RepID=A0A847SW26_9BACT|nr:hypothetical protein [Chitinophaga eiseniae]NLR81152.1 hypothetical protein [Chitinophaga eiseniae]